MFPKHGDKDKRARCRPLQSQELREPPRDSNAHKGHKPRDPGHHGKVPIGSRRLDGREHERRQRYVDQERVERLRVLGNEQLGDPQQHPESDVREHAENHGKQLGK